MTVVSFRIDAADLAYLRRRKANLSAVARQGVQTIVQRMRLEEDLAAFDRVRATTKREAPAPEDVIRANRDAH